MPPKGKKKAGKGKKMPKEDPKPAEELALLQIKMQNLDDQLEIYKVKCDELKRETKESKSQRSILEKEKKDMFAYAQHCLLEREDKVAELTQHLERQLQASNSNREALELQHSQLQDRVKVFTSENEKLEARLSGVEEFQKEKEQQMSNMASLRKQLVTLKEEHEVEIHNLNLKASQEKQRLEKDMDSHVMAMTQEVKHLVDQRITQTTKAAIQENKELKAKFTELAEHAQVLMEENFVLRDKNRKLRMNEENLEETVRELTCKSNKLSKENKETSQQLSVLQRQLSAWRNGPDLFPRNLNSIRWARFK